MNSVKISFWKRLKLAIFNFEKYQEFALEKVSVALKYFVKLMLLFSAVISLGIVYQFSIIANEGIRIFNEEIPNFTLSNNELKVETEEPKVIEYSDKFSAAIIIDTNVVEDDEIYNNYTSKISIYQNGAIFMKDKIILKTGMSNAIMKYSYEDLENKYHFGEVTKEPLSESIGSLNWMTVYLSLYITFVIYMFSLYVLATILDVALASILGFIVSKIAGVRLQYSQVFTISVYAITLSVLLNMIYIPVKLITGLNIEYFQIMYTTISYIYIVTAILMIRAELIKQQIEIRKIQEVQKEVKEEIKEREEKKKDEKKKETEDEKKENKQENDGTPEGSQA